MAIFTGQTVELAVETGLAQLGLSRSQVSITVLAKEKKGFLGFGKQPAQVEISALAGSVQELESAVSVEASQPSAEPTDSGQAHQEQPTLVEEQVTVEPSEQEVVAEENPADQEPMAEVTPVRVAMAGPAVVSQSAPELSAPAISQESQDQAPTSPEGEVSSNRQAMMVAAADVQAYVATIIEHMDIEAKIEPRFSRRQISLQIDTPEPGRLIGYHGKVLKSLQLLGQNYLHDRYSKNFLLSLNVHDYLEHRADTLIDMAHRIGERVLRTGEAYQMEPMTNSERKVVHKTISRMSGVESYSEGQEPHRYVVVVTRD